MPALTRAPRRGGTVPATRRVGRVGVAAAAPRWSPSVRAPACTVALSTSTLLLFLALSALATAPAAARQAGNGQQAPPSAPGTTLTGPAKVADGDTLEIQTPNGPARVRLWGVDAPELASANVVSQITRASKALTRSVERHGKDIARLLAQQQECANKLASDLQRLRDYQLHAILAPLRRQVYFDQSFLLRVKSRREEFILRTIQTRVRPVRARRACQRPPYPRLRLGTRALTWRPSPQTSIQIDLISQVLHAPEDWAGPAPELLAVSEKRLLASDRAASALARWNARIKAATERCTASEARFRDAARKTDAKWGDEARRFCIWALMEGGVRRGPRPRVKASQGQAKLGITRAWEAVHREHGVVPPRLQRRIAHAVCTRCCRHAHRARYALRCNSPARSRSRT